MFRAKPARGKDVYPNIAKKQEFRTRRVPKVSFRHKFVTRRVTFYYIEIIALITPLAGFSQPANSFFTASKATRWVI